LLFGVGFATIKYFIDSRLFRQPADPAYQKGIKWFINIANKNRKIEGEENERIKQ